MKKVTDLIKTFKNIPIIHIGEEILYINSLAKKILSVTKKNQQEVYYKIITTIKNKKQEMDFNINNKIKSFTLKAEQIQDKPKKQYLCFLFEKSSELNEEKIHKFDLYEIIFDNLPIGILIHDFGKTKYINQYGKKVLEVKNDKQYKNFNILNFLISEKGKQRAIKRIKSKKNLLLPEVYEIQTFNKNKKIIELYSYVFPHSNNKQITRLIVFVDKTQEIERQKTEIEAHLKEQENRLLKKQNQVKEKLLNELKSKQEQLFNTIHHSDYLFYIIDQNLNVVIFNHAFYEYCKKFYNFSVAVGNNLLSINQMNESEKNTLLERRKFLQQIIGSKKEIVHEITHYDKGLKKNRIFKVTMKPVFTTPKKLKHFYCYGHEITEKYEFLNQIEQQAIKLNEIVEHSPIYLWSMNLNQELTLFNKNYEHIIGELYGEKPETGKKLSKGKYQQNKEMIELLNYHYKKAFNGSHENFKLNFEIDENKKITLDVNLFPITVNNEIKEVAGIAVDITHEIEKQKQLENLLSENEVLMKEVHHRIKNNLQVISSMINLQLQEESDIRTKNALLDTQNRVFSMATIHQTLYQNRNYSSINISNSIITLIQNIVYSFNKTDIQIYPEIEEIILDVNTAIPLALIINESITNILKYAFPEHFIGEKSIFISLKRTGLNIELIVKDNGTGIPQKQMQNIISNIGFSIIRALSEQINAQLFITSQPHEGTEIKILIPQL